MAGETIKLNLKTVPLMERHPKIFDAWEELEAGSTLQIINDHDPKPLHYQFEGEYQGSYEWEYVQKGPENWVVNIKKLKLAESSEEDLNKRVQEALDEIRPYLQADGGDVELVELDPVAKVVKVRLVGACGGCPSAEMTLKGGVERAIKKHAPEIKSVDAVTA
jgi:uncharacterized protein (DUF2249 family)